MGQLKTHVHVADDNGEYHAFGPDDDLPSWAIDAIGEHAFEDGKKPAKKSDAKLDAAAAAKEKADADARAKAEAEAAKTAQKPPTAAK